MPSPVNGSTTKPVAARDARAIACSSLALAISRAASMEEVSRCRKQLTVLPRRCSWLSSLCLTAWHCLPSSLRAGPVRRVS